MTLSRSYPHLPKLYATKSQRSALGLTAGEQVEFQRVDDADPMSAEVLLPARAQIADMNARGVTRYVSLDGFEMEIGIDALRTALGAMATEEPPPAAPLRLRTLEPAPTEDPVDPDEDDDRDWFRAFTAAN